MLAATLIAAGCASIEPKPTGEPASTASPVATPALTSTPTATPVPTLRIDGMATVVPADGLKIWSTTKRKGAKALTPQLTAGAAVYLIGSKHADGLDWWQVQPDWARIDQTPPFGWVRATDDKGAPTLTALAPNCPNPGHAIDPVSIGGEMGLRALSCFRGTAITAEGTLNCFTGVRDGGAGGASWINSYWWCNLDDLLPVWGAPIDALQVGDLASNPTHARYRVVGHFDDPESKNCSWFGIGASLTTPTGKPDPAAVIVCRQEFIATELTKLD